MNKRSVFYDRFKLMAEGDEQQAEQKQNEAPAETPVDGNV